MGNSRDRILLVESDPVISDLIGRQALRSLGYQVQIAGDATAAISQATQFQPDVLIVNLNLPGLSGKDFLIALASQGIHAPVIVVARKGMEADIIQAFRLGASDFLFWPARDASVVSVVERVLRQVRASRERESLTQQLQQAKQDLQAQESLQQLAASLRAPIETVQGNLGLLLSGKKGKITPEQHSLIVATQEKISLMGKTVAEMTNPAVGPSKQVVRINLNDLSRQALARYHRVAMHSGLTLVSQLASPPVTALGESTEMARILDGLLSNAIKFTQPGGQVTVTTELSADRLPQISVRDTGAGIDPKKLPRIFDADAPKREPITIISSGACLTLRNIRELVTAWGGKIWAESQTGRGTTLHVTLQSPGETSQA